MRTWTRASEEGRELGPQRLACASDKDRPGMRARVLSIPPLWRAQGAGLTKDFRARGAGVLVRALEWGALGRRSAHSLPFTMYMGGKDSCTPLSDSGGAASLALLAVINAGNRGVGVGGLAVRENGSHRASRGPPGVNGVAISSLPFRTVPAHQNLKTGDELCGTDTKTAQFLGIV